MKFEIKNRWTNNVQFTAEIECNKKDSISVKIGLAVKWAIIAKADLRWADLRWADLGGEDLRGADLRGADLRWADLGGADLGGADLRGADLRWADLRWANLRWADLRGADLRGAKNIPVIASAQTVITPQGELIVFKKLADGSICTLKIPFEAKRSNASGRKCRAEYAIVISGEGVSQHDSSFVYRVGETVRPREPFDEDRWNECGSGIHFFLTEEEAKEYVI